MIKDVFVSNFVTNILQWSSLILRSCYIDASCAYMRRSHNFDGLISNRIVLEVQSEANPQTVRHLLPCLGFLSARGYETVQMTLMILPGIRKS